jgi:hypothetical protein
LDWNRFETGFTFALGWNMSQRRHEASANDSNFPNLHPREGFVASVQIKPVIFTLIRCTSSELFFSCCGNAVTPRAMTWALRSSTCGA